MTTDREREQARIRQARYRARKIETDPEAFRAHRAHLEKQRRGRLRREDPEAWKALRAKEVRESRARIKAANADKPKPPKPDRYAYLDKYLHLVPEKK